MIAESYIRDNYAERELEDLFREYQSAASGLVIFTFGGGGGDDLHPVSRRIGRANLR